MTDRVTLRSSRSSVNAPRLAECMQRRKSPPVENVFHVGAGTLFKRNAPIPLGLVGTGCRRRHSSEVAEFVRHLCRHGFLLPCSTHLRPRVPGRWQPLYSKEEVEQNRACRSAAGSSCPTYVIPGSHRRPNQEERPPTWPQSGKKRTDTDYGTQIQDRTIDSPRDV